MKKVEMISTKKITRGLYLLLILLLGSFGGYAQNVGINATGAVPNANAGLDVDFSNKGILIPRVALTGTATPNPLAAHVAGMIVYNTATVADVSPGFYYDNGSRWVASIPTGNVAGDMLYWNGTTWVLIPAGTAGQFLQFSSSSIPTWTGAAFATITTSAITSITGNSATSGGNITSDGGTPVLARGICYGTSPTPTTLNSTIPYGSGTGSFVCNLTGLSSMTTYYVRAYAVNNSVTSYGNELSFTTTGILPILAATTPATSITGTSAITGGNVTSDGGSPISERGVCYAITQNPTIANNKVIDGAPGTGVFISNLTGLTGYTTYYVRAYATNSMGTGYGTQISFTTLIIPPTLVTVPATSITGFSALSGGSMSWNGGGYSNYQNYGVAYSTSSGSLTPTYVATNTVNGQVNISVPIPPWTTTVTPLSANTIYYIRSYLQLYRVSPAGWITVFGNELSFTTTSPTAPVIASTLAVTVTSANTATSGGTITTDGGAPITAKGVCWDTNPNPTLGASNFTSNGTGPGAFGSSVTGLTGNTAYYLRAYATNSVGTAYGPVDQVFTTWIQAPFALGQWVGYGWCAYVAPDGTGFIVSDDIYSTAGWGCNGLTVGCSAAFGSGQANTNLILACSVGTTTAASVANDYSITYNGITYNDWFLPSSGEWAKISDAATLVGIYGHSTNNFYTSSEYGASTAYASTYFVNYSSPYASGANRVPGPNDYVYYLRVIRTFSAATLAAVTTDAVTNIGAITATSGGNVTSDGGVAVTAGVCWSTITGPTIADPHTVDASATGPFVSNITGLTPNTIYYVRAYATNIVGTAYGNEVTFTTTPPTAPVITTEPITAQTDVSGTSGGTIISDGGNPITVSGICWNTTGTPTIADLITADGTTSGTFLSTATGLTPLTPYYIRAYATNGIGTGYGNEIAFTPVPAGYPTVSTDPMGSLVGSIAEGNYTVINEGATAVTQAGLCWSTSPNPTILVNNGMINDPYWFTGGAGFSFPLDLTGLTVGTLYYVRAFATNTAGTAYGSDVSFTATAATLGQNIYLNYTGGVVYSISNGGANGLIALNFNPGLPADWGCSGFPAIGTTGTAVGTGSANTDAIIADILANGCVSAAPIGDFAAPVSKWFGFPDWYLPSKDELDLLVANQNVDVQLSNIVATYIQFWSSSEVDAANAWYLDTTGPTPTWISGPKTGQYYIWPIRSF